MAILKILNGLWLYNNQLSGAIPPELGNLSNLVELHLQRNELSGSIPAELGNLSNLKWLDLSDNNLLSGSIPAELGNLSNLEWLDLSGTKICLPASLKDWKFYYSDHVSKCQSDQDIEGDRAALIDFYNATDGANWTKKTNWLSDKPLGEWYRVETNAHGRVVRLQLSENQLSGPIPESIGNLTNLTTLRLFSNQLSGSIPESIGNLSNLEVLALDDNQLSGSIPEFLGNQSNLTSLSLRHNQLSGSIPPELGNLSNLRYLALDGNQLSGSIPESFGNLTNLDILRLQRNQLTGPIPSSLGKVTNLRYLGLHFNQLSGSIPESFGNLSKLDILDLEGNQLSGPIPEFLGNLTNLELLHLRANQLTGLIPLTFQNLTNLTTLNYGPFVCLPDDPGIQQWVAKNNLLDGWHEGRLIYRAQLSYDCLPPIESWPPKADLIRQLENLGWFSVSFENADDFNHWQIYAIFEAVQKLNNAILGFPSHVSVPMKLSVRRSYEVHSGSPTVVADSGITFYPPAFSNYYNFFYFRNVMMHEIGHNLGIHGNGSLYTKTADPNRWIFNGPHANLKYKELKGNRGFENELITDGSGHWKGRFLRGDIMSGTAVLSAITLSALVDMGYKIDMTKADKLPFENSPYATKPTLSSTPMLPHTWCGGIAHSHVPHSQ